MFYLPLLQWQHSFLLGMNWVWTMIGYIVRKFQRMSEDITLEVTQSEDSYQQNMLRKDLMAADEYVRIKML